jgi:hypothetical protein
MHLKSGILHSLSNQYVKVQEKYYLKSEANQALSNHYMMFPHLYKGQPQRKRLIEEEKAAL